MNDRECYEKIYGKLVNFVSHYSLAAGLLRVVFSPNPLYAFFKQQEKAAKCTGYIVLLLVIFSGCASKVVYKCPNGQVSILEDEGLETEAIRCYTPGTYYHDYRPISEKRIKSWKNKEIK